MNFARFVRLAVDCRPRYGWRAVKELPRLRIHFGFFFTIDEERQKCTNLDHCGPYSTCKRLFGDSKNLAREIREVWEKFQVDAALKRKMKRNLSCRSRTRIRYAAL